MSNDKLFQCRNQRKLYGGWKVTHGEDEGCAFAEAPLVPYGKAACLFSPWQRIKTDGGVAHRVFPQ